MITEIKVLTALREANRSMTIRQISKAIRSDYRITHTGVKRLAGKGALDITTVGKSSLCSINASHFGMELYIAEQERRNRLLRDRNISALFKEVMGKIGTRLFVFLIFGSYAKGSQKVSSDIDLMFIANEKGLEERVLQILSLLPLKCHPIIFTEEEFIRMRDSAKQNVIKEAISHNIILFGIESYYGLKNAG
ncbi:MAG TPA: nucleotidyltransferase domain-containing protein [Candidatus Nanoarchaeia archaeon]|nr:nucleotidyltransferase domain-containing protein [Candidatus Nanoarchaeia archaeon]